ncbi:MAG TPA: hypothetical protein VJ826_15695 [Candidatus Polarisedimenticolaceae bacterium]|nr:hypothetical protein [Candidatus Polarisedimenticolaceae bacterium]
MRRGASLLLIALAASACGPSPEDVPRVYEDKARGVRYTCPAHWKLNDGEIRSKEGSLLSLRVWDLVEADKKFVAGLPDSLFPQIEGWTTYYYIVDGEPTRKETQVAGLPATEWNYKIRIRPKDAQGKVTYWVVRRATRLFLIRAAYPPKGLEADEAAIRGVIAGWAFL